MKRIVRRPSPASIVAILALVVASSGTAFAVASSQNGDTLITKNTLSANRIRLNTITSAEMSNLAWGGVILQNGWAAGVRRPRAAVDAQGIVHLKGTVTGGNATTIGTLPHADAPTSTIYLSAHDKQGGTVGIVLLSNGSMILQATVGPNMFVGLDGISYAR
jgi:hypothetical protein